MDNTITPQECPGCGKTPEILVLHHWGHKKGNSKLQDKYYSIEAGKYRYICDSCNVRLGIIFRRNYPDSWEEQLKALQAYSSNLLYPTNRLPYITYLEGNIFFLYAKDSKEAKRETVKEFLKFKEPKTASRGSLHNLCRVKCLKGTLRPLDVTEIFARYMPHLC